jgi:hypothetical protein
VIAWTGLPQLLLIPLVPLLMKRLDARWLVGVGLLVFAASCFMNIELDRNYAGPQLLWPNIVSRVRPGDGDDPAFGGRDAWDRTAGGGQRVGSTEGCPRLWVSPVRF